MFAWQAPIAIEANYARAHRNEIALLASLGYLSVIAPDGLTYSRMWHITAEGLYALRHHQGER